MKIDGSCHCGAVTYEAEVDPENVMVCHCTDCQRFSGGPYRPLAPTNKNTFKLLSGALTIYSKTGENGAPRAQAFCPNCGTPIYSSAMEDNPQVHNIRLGSVRQRDQLSPRRQIWIRSKQSWIDELADLPQMEKQ